MLAPAFGQEPGFGAGDGALAADPLAVVFEVFPALEPGARAVGVGGAKPPSSLSGPDGPSQAPSRINVAGPPRSPPPPMDQRPALSQIKGLLRPNSHQVRAGWVPTAALEIPMIELPALMEDAERLAPLPQSSNRLASLLVGEEWDIKQVCEVVRLDEALTGRLLSVANSARSGARSEIATVDGAVMRLGTGTVLGLALGAAVRREYQCALPAYGLDEGGLWRHSVASALAIEEASRFCERTLPPEAFATALLHDIGKLVLSRHLTDDMVEALHRAQGEAAFDAITEREVLAIEHAELGAVIVRNWRLPESIATGVEFHERPFEAPSDEGRVLATLVGLADAAAVRAGAPCGGPEPDPEFTPLHAGALGISAKGFAELCTAVEARLEDVLACYE